ncbi:MAG: glycosyltransferase family 2 protein [Gemmatimonadaceae bacterium]|nr:glycosyltransferase family 2 protein [Gemmatimonadaceae bacterium]
MNETPHGAAIAVVVPVFNRMEFLEATVASLRAQTMNNAEFILVDDRSELHFWRYLESLPGQDRRFRILRKPDHIPRGCQSSRNIGLDACGAKAVMFLDSDDLIGAECLEDRHAMVESNPDADLVVGPQAMFTHPAGPLRWVNVPRPGVSELDRFLDVAGPLDVPWVNGGVVIRMRSLNAAGIRWRPGFHWDDVAFHFECLVAGLRVEWMSFTGPADAYYRMHHGERYGAVLSAPDGVRSATKMFGWMWRTLEDADRGTQRRREALAVSFFHSCVLRSIDAGNSRSRESSLSKRRRTAPFRRLTPTICEGIEWGARYSSHHRAPSTIGTSSRAAISPATSSSTLPRRTERFRRSRREQPPRCMLC